MVCTFWYQHISSYNPKADNMFIRGQLKCDDARTKTRFRLSAKQTSSFKSVGGVSSVDYWQPRCASVVVMLDTPCSKVV